MFEINQEVRHNSESAGGPQEALQRTGVEKLDNLLNPPKQSKRKSGDLETDDKAALRRVLFVAGSHALLSIFVRSILVTPLMLREK
jgi:hypothetical protein